MPMSTRQYTSPRVMSTTEVITTNAKKALVMDQSLIITNTTDHTGVITTLY